MASPRAISTGIGQGEAQVFRPGLSPESALEYNIRKKQAEGEAAAKRRAAQAKSQKEALKAIDDVALEGYLPNVNQLNENANYIRDYVARQYMDNPDYNVDNPVIKKMVGGLKKDVLTNKKVEDWAKSLRTYRPKADEFEGWDEVNKVLKMPLADQVKYAEENPFPYPTPKTEIIDYEPMFQGLASKLGTKQSTVERPLEEGGTEVIGSTRVPSSVKQEAISDMVDAGIKGRNPKAVQFVEDIKVKLSEDFEFQNAPEEKQAKMIMEEAQQEGERRLNKYLDEKFSKTMQGQGKGSTLIFGGGGDVENDQVRVVVSEDAGKRVYDIAEIKTGENKLYDFSLPDGQVVKGIPLRIEKSLKTGGKDVIISVPKYTTKTEGFGKGRITKKVPTGEYEERKVPYKTNESRIFKGKFKFTLDDIDKGQQEKGVQVKSMGEANTISLADARKANPGVSDKDLISQYAKYGYTVK